jgi:hypothetical protein
MNSDNNYKEESAFVSLFCHFSFWFGLLFATPLFIAFHNGDDIVFSTLALAVWSGVTCLAASQASWKLAGWKGSRVQWWVSRVLLAAAIVLAIQGNVINDLFYYGSFNGQRVDFRGYGWLFWAEWLGWLASFPLALLLLSRLSPLPKWAPLLPVASFCILLAPLLLLPADKEPANTEEVEIDSSVFAFSSTNNLVHLLADGFQGDVVRQVLQENPGLADRFRGFTLFTDHVGLYQGTAPALYTILTGKPFEFEEGFSYKRIVPEIREHAYPFQLAEEGFQLDFVPISGFICPKTANSCHVRPFNDMKARGFFRHRGEDVSYSIRLIADLSLFRLAPMFLKEKIHDGGRWFFADTTMDGSSPWPDPVLREWTENLQVVDDRPVYKWYHYVGTHIPAKWDDQCRPLGEAGTDRKHYVAQAYCILNGIAGLLDRLEQAGIYDQTAFLITGDHGHNTVPDDVTSPPMNSQLYPGLMGSGRPALLIKRKNNREALEFSNLPTSLVDVAPTALSLAGLEGTAPSAFDISMEEDRNRPFQQYSIPEFYTGNPIPYVEYQVGQPARDGGQSAVSKIQRYDQVPTGYDPVNRPNADGFVLGAKLRKSMGNNKASWISGHQLALIIRLPEPAAPGNLELTLHLPEWVPEQRFTVQLNDGPRWNSPRMVAGEEFWQTVSVPLAVDHQKAGKNFLSIEFERTYPQPDSDSWKGAALIQSIRFVPGDQAAAEVLSHQ